MKLPYLLCLIFSFYFVSPVVSPLLSCATNRPLLFLRSRSGTVFQDLSTRDARENNLESTLVVTAAMATTTTMTLPNQPPTYPHRPKMSFHSLFHFLPLAMPALWIVWSEVMARPENRKLPAAPSRINRRWTASDIRGTLSQRSSGRLPECCRLSSFLVRITSAWNRMMAKCFLIYRQFAIFSSRSK